MQLSSLLSFPSSSGAHSPLTSDDDASSHTDDEMAASGSMSRAGSSSSSSSVCSPERGSTGTTSSRQRSSSSCSSLPSASSLASAASSVMWDTESLNLLHVDPADFEDDDFLLSVSAIPWQTLHNEPADVPLDTRGNSSFIVFCMITLATVMTHSIDLCSLGFQL